MQKKAVNTSPNAYAILIASGNTDKSPRDKFYSSLFFLTRIGCNRMSFRTCFGISRLIAGGMGNKIGAEAPIFICVSGKRRLGDVMAGSFGGTMCFSCDDAPVIQVAVAPPGGYPTTLESVQPLAR